MEAADKTVTLDLDARDREFLREHIGDLAEGLREDLAKPDRLRDSEAAARELAAYEALVSGLDSGKITVTADLRRWAAELGRRNDHGNEWERAAREHLAFGALAANLSPGPES